MLVSPHGEPLFPTAGMFIISLHLCVLMGMYPTCSGKKTAKYIKSSEWMNKPG